MTRYPHPVLRLAVPLLLVACPLDGRAQPQAPDEVEEKAGSEIPGCEAPASLEEEAETRAGRLRQKRCAKAELPPEPYQAGFLERTILGIEKGERPSLMQMNLWGIYPRIQGIARGSRLAGGLRLWKPDIAASLDIHASAFYSLNDYQFYDFQIGRLPHPEVRAEAAAVLPLRSTKGDDVFELAAIQRGREEGGWLAYLSARWEHYTRLNYFGPGPDSLDSDRATFLSEGWTFEARAGYQLGPRFLVLSSFGLVDPSIGSGEDPDHPSVEDVFDDTTAPGLTQSPETWRFSTFFVFDTRDRPGNPNDGAILSLEYSRYDDRLDGSFTFNRFAGDLRGFIPLGSPQRVLALRAYAVQDDPVGEARVPFYLQPFIGGSHTLRGFDSFRFRGERMALFSAEYRWEPVPPVEFALLVDTGVVANPGEALDFDKRQTNWGVSLRLKTSFAYLFRIDWAKGPERSRLLFRFSPAW